MTQIPAFRDAVGTHDIVFVTLDTLRFDVADTELAAGRTPNLAKLLPGGRWERRHTPATFTFPAHQAFFAGFLPTPADGATTTGCSLHSSPVTPKISSGPAPGCSTRPPSSVRSPPPDTAPCASAASDSSTGRPRSGRCCPTCSRKATGARPPA